VTDVLLPPTRKDLMSYCAPRWVSGYTFQALAQRIALVANQIPSIAAVDR
jgi:hypothetical protein